LEDFGLDIAVRSLVDCELVALAGELDCQTSPQLAEALTEASDGGRPVVVDLTELHFIDSSGLHVLMSGADDGKRILVCPHGNVHRVLEIVRADRALPVFDELDAALDGVSGNARRSA